MKFALVFWCLSAVALAQTSPIELAVNAAGNGPQTPGLNDLISKAIPTPNGSTVWGQDYLFAATSAAPVTLTIGDQPPIPMMRIPGFDRWILLTKMRVGVTHSYSFFAEGKRLAGSDTTGYNPDSYPKPGVPKGKVSPQQTMVSKIYPGMKADYWIYASPGVDPNVPAPLMVWQDGKGMVGEWSSSRLFTVTENLVHQKLLPPLVYVLIQPGTAPDGKALRSIEYDTVSDRYARYVMEEILPEVEKQYKLRQDGYSRAIGGSSSGGICSFNVAWYFPDKFSRVHSTVGSFTSIQWHPEEKLEGGNVYPFKVRKEPKRNIRIWMSDGSEDVENEHGSWPMQNIQMANSLKYREYDYHFRFGTAQHSGSQMAVDLPESLAWLWRGYDPAKTSQQFVMDPADKDKPFYRVTISNRDAW